MGFFGDLIDDMFTSETTTVSQAEREKNEAWEKYKRLRGDFGNAFEKYLKTKSPAEQNRMKVYSQEMVEILHEWFGYLSYKSARIEVEKELNAVKARVYDKVNAEKKDTHKNATENNNFDNSSSRMKLRPFEGQRLNLEGTVESLEFADHDGQMQAIIKNVSVATPNGTVRYNHVNFFVDDALGDILLSRQGSKVAFSGKVTLYDRGHRSTDKGSAAKAYGFSDIRVK